ncbi:MAG: hypothetical protein KKD18_06620, partial [Nanoarchaeota archaeon]|nr:hypothetical protein [Nanoarchaeota archaeon]
MMSTHSQEGGISFSRPGTGNGKRLVMSVGENEFAQPAGLSIKGFVRRKGITNPAAVLRGDEVTLLGRLIFEDEYGDNSAIVKYDGKYRGGQIEIFQETERVIFSPEEPFGERGMEDFRIAKLDGERPYHGFLVHHNGRDARTEYLRTTERDPFDLTNWERFGIWFPNIGVTEAVDLVKDQERKRWWRIAHGSGEFLGTKDCSLWPEKVKRPGPDGPDTEYYGVPIRLLPDMQIVYVHDFRDLA